MSKKLIAKLALVTALATTALVGSQRLAAAAGGPVHCPNPTTSEILACRSWCLSQCTTRTCFADCMDLNCTCP